jgi:hypothetical protein
MPDVMPTAVISKILIALRDRLLTIDGQGEMVNDVQGRVLLRRPTFDADSERAPSIFLRVRTITRSQQPSESFFDVTVIFDAIGIVKADEDETLAGLEFKADIYRALEIEGDKFLRDDECNANLLNQELAIVDAQLEDLQAASTFDLVGVGVQCTFPQKYGAPNHVQR